MMQRSKCRMLVFGPFSKQIGIALCTKAKKANCQYAMD
jgi:hypothetical protein